MLTVQDSGPGGEVEARPGEFLPTRVTWQSHYPVTRVDILFNGDVVARDSMPSGSTEGVLEADVIAPSDGWTDARLSSTARDSFYQPMFAHTSPVYVTVGVDSPERAEAARWFSGSIERSLEWVRTKGKYYNDTRRREIVDLFRSGQQVYKAMLK